MKFNRLILINTNMCFKLAAKVAAKPKDTIQLVVRKF